MSPSLHLAPGLFLPPEAATETFLLVGKRGSGKSSTATRLAEEMIRRAIQIAVLDPVDVWWGLKAGADGGREGGLKVYVFGGEHGDLPLEATAGALMAETLVEHQINAVFVLRAFSNRDKARFVADFAERLYQRNRETLHLFCEEAHEFMPQTITFKGQGEEEMLGRMLRLVKLGRTSGIGVSSITQRPASLNKNTTTQAEVLIAHRLLGPQDLDAVDGWIKHHQQQEHRQEVLSTLGELRTGEAWIWAPDFPEVEPIGLRRVPILMPRTYDSRRTPKPGEHRREPKSLAPVDLKQLQSKMAATIERAKQEDPRELRRQIADLRAEAARVKSAQPAAKIEPVEVPVVKAADLHRLEAALEKIDKLRDRMAQAQQVVVTEAGLLRQALGKACAPTPKPAPMPPGKVPVATSPKPAPGTVNHPPSEGISSSQQRILDALAWLENVGIGQAAKTQVALLADQSPTSGGYFNNLGRLRSSGLIHYPSASVVALTVVGRSAARSGDIPTTSEALHAQLFRKLSGSQAEILRRVIAAYPKEIAKQDLAEQAGQSPTSGGYFNNLGRLRSLGLIEYPGPGRVVATPVLFLDR